MKKIKILESQFDRVHPEIVQMRADRYEFKLSEMKKLAIENIYKAFELGRIYERDYPQRDVNVDELKLLQKLTKVIDGIQV